MRSQSGIIAGQEALTAQTKQVLVCDTCDLIVVMQQIAQQRINKCTEDLNRRGTQSTHESTLPVSQIDSVLVGVTTQQSHHTP